MPNPTCVHNSKVFPDFYKNMTKHMFLIYWRYKNAILLSLCLTFDKQVFFFPVEAINATDVQENNDNIIKKHILMIQLQKCN